MSVITLIEARAHDLGGGFNVRRLLPNVKRQAVGPFLFFDHFGPVTAQPSDNHDVRPHPHIGLATVTYLFEGAMMHRDSTGVVQRIEPGAINWMTAGRGIVHSERTPDDLRAVTRRSHGLQLWCAVPGANEDDAPSFAHTAADAIPTVDIADVAAATRRTGATVRVLVGSAWGVTSPVATLSATVYLDIALAAGATIAIPDLASECALYSVDADFEVDGGAVAAHQMAVLATHKSAVVHSRSAARIILIGGEPLGHRHIAWNFVSSRAERIAEAKADWLAQRFDPVPGETEFIPLPPGLR
jgi:redox-sensitive bicupin YhaK (pirin superfamily)